ncbi:hemagglutinin/amebocyte aggregation factor-like [Pomacea canaliculata]|uniref:hemagglutinin/amebocyte aggregation factor-like n=1 Tax=Pomacea canaliculata TaxID=400727 RepID=UPI000D732D3C|nr:hemagglutinin/amebocyte aggregation factor-like [Pomacea canaliculata]
MLLPYLLLTMAIIVMVAGWVNENHSNFRFSCPEGQALTSIQSIYSNEKKYRLWEFGCSDIPRHHSRTTLLAIMFKTSAVGHVMLVLAFVPKVSGWVNDFEMQVNFSCPRGHSVSAIRSDYNSYYTDRVWDFKCSPIARIGKEESCMWKTPINGFSQQFVFNCPWDGYISGVQSFYDKTHRDREFNFLCCHFSDTMMKSCSFTANWINNWRSHFHFTVPSNSFLSGVSSNYCSHKKDRQFSLSICTLRAQK